VGANLQAASEANAKIQAQFLKESSPLLGGLIKDGKLSVVAAFYDVESGKVTLLN
jgi:carbonic anhydrase